MVTISVNDTYTLNNGVKMPFIGLGVYKAENGSQVKDAVLAAIEAGYRHIDTASFYGNEKGVGEAIRASDVPRDSLFITTKVWNDDLGYEETLRAFEVSMDNLGLDYLDLYLIHWPIEGRYTEAWKALEKLYDEGRVKAIGVSNFHRQHLEGIFAMCRVKPMLNQLEYHPHLAQKEMHAFCKAHDIQLEAWAPLKRGGLFEEPVIQQLVEKHGKTPAQIILRWDLQNGVSTIPKSVTPSRIQENIDIFDFELSGADMEKIDSLDSNQRMGKNPDNFSFDE
ncbi:aldo/keto reductase [Salinicoccus bachuensis]|uniref:Aldo/keto reductase n=1 Tax=Salinicoccus bachuensis TaxID=3136731 RepID=A0ABZ3CH52_9STAP